MKMIAARSLLVFISCIIPTNGFQYITRPRSFFPNHEVGSNLHFPHQHEQINKFSPRVNSGSKFFSLASQRQEVIDAIDDEISMKKASTEDSLSLKTQPEESEMPLAEFAPIIVLCWFVTLLSSLDRVAMSVAILPLSSEFHFSETTKGAISSIFSLGYGVGIIPAGLLVSSVSPKLIMATGVTLWSLATFGTPIAANLINVVQNVDTMTTTEVSASAVYIAENVAPLLAIRSVMGAAESVVLPTIQRFMSNWVPASKKSASIATVYSGFQTGAVCAYLISPWIIDNFGGWRGLFYIYGGTGALWLVPWWLFAQDYPKYFSQGTRDGNSSNNQVLVNELKEEKSQIFIEQRLINANRMEASEVSDDEIPSWEEAAAIMKDAPWKGFLQSKATWAMTLAHAANNWGLYNFLSWTPIFYAEQYGLNTKESAFLSLVPSIAGALGGLFAGFAADKILEEFVDEDDLESRGFLRRTFQSLALIGPAVCLLTLAYQMPDEPAVAQTLLTGTVGLQAFNSAGYGAATQEKAGEKWAGLLYSVTSLPGVIFGSVGVYVTGVILDATNQNWSEVFALNGAVFILGGLSFFFLYNSEREFD